MELENAMKKKEEELREKQAEIDELRMEKAASQSEFENAMKNKEEALQEKDETIKSQSEDLQRLKALVATEAAAAAASRASKSSHAKSLLKKRAELDRRSSERSMQSGCVENNEATANKGDDEGKKKPVM